MCEWVSVRASVSVCVLLPLAKRIYITSAHIKSTAGYFVLCEFNCTFNLTIVQQQCSYHATSPTPSLTSNMLDLLPYVVSAQRVLFYINSIAFLIISKRTHGDYLIFPFVPQVWGTCKKLCKVTESQSRSSSDKAPQSQQCPQGFIRFSWSFPRVFPLSFLSV